MEEAGAYPVAVALAHHIQQGALPVRPRVGTPPGVDAVVRRESDRAPIRRQLHESARVRAGGHRELEAVGLVARPPRSQSTDGGAVAVPGHETMDRRVEQLDRYRASARLDDRSRGMALVVVAHSEDVVGG